MQPYYSHNGITIYLGDCRAVLPSLSERPAASARQRITPHRSPSL